MEDLWPDDIKVATKIKAPVTILKEQAALLGEKTDNIVIGSISSYKPLGLAIRVFYYRFYIEAPILGGYRYVLLSISHDIELYPVFFNIDKSLAKELFDQEEIIANTEEEFIGILKKIFNSNKTKRVVSSILAQSSAA